MRMIAALFLTTALCVGEAQSSSILILEDVQDVIGPSIVEFNELPGGSVIETQEVESGSTVELSATLLQSPSITVLSEPAGEATPSVVVIGPMDSVTEDTIGNDPAATTRQAASTPLMPMVIRGGIVGDALMRPAASSTQSEPAADAGA